MLSTPGVGSGLDISGIISQLMAVERRPLVKLGTTQVELNTQLSAFGKLKSVIGTFRGAMNELASTDKFAFMSANSSDTNLLRARAEPGAAPGNYQIEIVRVAEHHRLAAGNVFADADSTLVGNPGERLTIAVGSRSFGIDHGGLTLAGIRDAINQAPDNAGVTAAIIRDDSGYRLTLTARSVGSDHLVAVEARDAANVPVPDPFAWQTLNSDRDASGGFAAADLDAVLRLENAFTVTRSSNEVTDVIDGVTLSLVKPGAVTLDVARDTARIRGSLNQFLGAYNEVATTLTEMRTGILGEERGALRNLEAQFRAIFNRGAGTSENFSYLFELGVSTRRDGTLSLDAGVFDAALARDPDGVADLFANPTNGLAMRLTTLADGLIGAGGVLDGRETSLNARIRALGTARANLEARLVRKEEALVQQFSALDALVAGLTTTSNFLGTQLDQLAQLNQATRSSRRG